MADKIVKTVADLQEVLSKITFAPSCVNLDWQWDIETVYADRWEVSGIDMAAGCEDYARPLRGWLVNTSFVRPDTTTGEVSRGKGRQEFIAVGTSESGVVKTCWVLAKMIIHHELMEAFHYKGARIFDPHNTVEELSIAHNIKKEGFFILDCKVWKKTEGYR